MKLKIFQNASHLTSNTGLSMDVPTGYPHFTKQERHDYQEFLLH